MTSITREEFEAKIEVIETRMDARVDRMEVYSREMQARIDARVDRLDARFDRMEQRMDGMISRDEQFKNMLAERDAKLTVMVQQATSAADRSERLAQNALTLKGHFWTTVLLFVTTIVGTVYGPKASSMIFDDDKKVPVVLSLPLNSTSLNPSTDPARLLDGRP